MASNSLAGTGPEAKREQETGQQHSPGSGFNINSLQKSWFIGTATSEHGERGKPKTMVLGGSSG